MARRWRDPTAFRADPSAVPPTRPSRRQSSALLLVLAVIAGTVAAVSYLVRPDDARTFDLFRGSVFLADSVAPVAVDLATGRPTVRLVDASAQVGAKRAQDLGVEPTADGTLLLNKQTGEFNMVETTGFVVKNDGGVPLPQRDGATGAVGVAAQDFSYIEQTGPTGTSVYLVGSSTVQSAAAGGKQVKPRAFVSMDEPTDTAPGTSAATGNDLWMLAGTGTERTVRRLSLPPNSSPGATLAQTDTGTVTGPAAVATASTVGDDATTLDGISAPDTVGIASADRIVVRRGAQLVATVRFAAPAGVDQVLAATNGTNRLSYLLHGTAGWSVVSVAADGSDRQGPTMLGTVAAGAKLIPPAASEGDLFTMDTTSGDLIRISSDGRAEAVDGIATYPVATQNGRAIENGSFDDAYVLARGPRVVVNSPNHQIAVAIFADGSHRPVQIQKSSAVSVNAAGGAEALARSRIQDAPAKSNPEPGKPKPTARPVDPINNRIDCASTSQKPHIPALGQPVPGSRSVLLNWTYPVTDQNDCIPKTYVVGVKLLGSGPQPPSKLTVDGQLGINLTGLFPSTRYEITLTAYINGKGTSSTPIQITTGPEGPAAPSQVTATPDSSGNWNIGWRSCGTVASGCVPSSTWRVIPQLCDSRGLGSSPATLEVAADPTSVTQPGAVLRGGSSLLGRGLRFQVEGIGQNGQVGTPSATTGCTTSWAPPVTSALKLTASKPANVDVGASTTTTLSLGLGSDAVRTVGGVGATVTFTLTGPGGVQTRTVTVDGRSSTLTQTFGGVTAGGTYKARAQVSPPGHPGSAVTVDAPVTTPQANWPTLNVDTSCPTSGLFACGLAITIGGVSSAASGGETFDLVNSTYQCGSRGQGLDQTNFDPKNTKVTATVNRLLYNGSNCSVTIQLKESGGKTTFFGGALSKSVTVPFSPGAAPQADISASDFTAKWPTSGSSAQVTYTGGEDLGKLTDDWAEVLHPPGSRNTVCGSNDTQLNGKGDSAFVDGGDCIDEFGDKNTGWVMTVSYSDTTDGDDHSFDIKLADGVPASYQPCAPTVTAKWGAKTLTGANTVDIVVAGDKGGCKSWTYQLVTPTGSSCGTDAGNPPGRIVLNCGTAPSQDDWKVMVGWTKPDGSDGNAMPDPPVTGAPPTP